MVRGAGLTEGNVPVQTVHRAGRSVDQVLHRVPSGRFQHAQEAVDVVGDVGKRIAERVPDPRLGRQMAHHVELLAGEQRQNSVLIGQVEPHELQAVVLRLRHPPVVAFRLGHDYAELPQAVQFQLHVVVRVEVVDADYLVILLHQPASQVKADETGRARNEELHGGRL